MTPPMRSVLERGYPVLIADRSKSYQFVVDVVVVASGLRKHTPGGILSTLGGDGRRPQQ